MADAGFILTEPGSRHVGPQEVHVWVADLDRLAERLPELAKLLEPEEQAKAARFRFDKDRNHYTAARGVLRLLLGNYLDTSPSLVRFAYNAYGKPRLDWAAGAPPLEFNLSHSHGLALYAFTPGRQIGVDIEHIRPDIAAQEMARRFFAPAEAAALEALPKEQRIKGFFIGWARKEAFIKARGLGLSLPLNQFAVSITEGAPALLSVQGEDAANRWTILEIPVPEGYAGAAAIEGLVSKLERREFCWPKC